MSPSPCKLEGQADLEGLDECRARVVDAHEAKQAAQEDDKVVVQDGVPVQTVSLELQVEVAGPDEAQHGAGERADEAHQDGEVGDEDGHEHGEDNHAHFEGEPPHLYTFPTRL